MVQSIQVKKKFIFIKNAFDKLEISKDEFLKSNKKGIYFGYTCYDSKDYLNNTTNITTNTTTSPNIINTTTYYQYYDD